MTQSMVAVIKPGDVVWTVKMLPWSHFDKTDIVAFQKEGNSATFVKRIVAISGDTLHFLRNAIIIEDHKIPHDPIFEMMVEESTNDIDSYNYNSQTYSEYLLRNVSGFDSTSSYIINDGNALKVPDNYYFVVGDNHYESMDSRFWGFISKDDIKGKVFWVF